jgi:hypothetical protein
MPSPLQTASARRKLIYLGLILGLFVVNTFLWRGVSFSSPLSTGGKPLPWTVQAQANKLELTEETQGDPDLLGSITRLVLTGSRGLVITVLCWQADELKKRNEWNKLEVNVRATTKLQPHFLTPWLFQSWNLSYNVSVECDRVKDKYYFISRGIELLAQGERLNKDNPDMRYWIGFYYQNKFGVSDENNSLRSLYQLSCIPPEKRNPDLIAPKDPQTGRRKVDEKKFEDFCKEHPQLVRRLREPPKELTRPFRCNTPEEVVEFLTDNRKLPSRYFDADDVKGQLLAGRPGDVKPADQQFPVLPTARPERYHSNEEEPTAATVVDDSFDPFTAARAWFAYAQDPLPDPDPLSDAIDRKERVKTLKDRRLPRQPAEVIFRQSPCRAQSYIGERLQKEGWFDGSGWAVDAGRSGLERWFPRSRGEVVIGSGKEFNIDAWTRAYGMWKETGIQNGILFKSPTDEIDKVEKARKFEERFGITPGDLAFPFRPEAMDPEMREALLAHRWLAQRELNMRMTNLPHFVIRAEAEKDRATAQARKTIDQAETLRRRAEPEQAIEEYKKGFTQWQNVLRDYPAFREDSSTQEELYETEVHYLDLIQEPGSTQGEQIRQALTFQGLTTAALSASAGGGSPAPLATGLMYRLVIHNRALPLPVLGPLDGNDSTGKPWFSQAAIATVQSRLRSEAPQAQKPPPGAPSRPNPRR